MHFDIQTLPRLLERHMPKGPLALVDSAAAMARTSPYLSVSAL